MNMRIIYTCITNDYDTLQPIQVPPGYRAIAFMNERGHDTMKYYAEMLPMWEIQIIPSERLHHKIHREIKINPHKFLPRHELSIWMDGNITPKMDVYDFAAFMEGKEHGLWIMKHPERDCIYDEAEACIRLQKDSEKVIRAQMREYESFGTPRHIGLVGSGVIIRENDSENMKFNERWWMEVKNHSVRDQLSFNHCAWLYDFEYNTFDFLYEFEKVRHTKRAD